MKYLTIAIIVLLTLGLLVGRLSRPHEAKYINVNRPLPFATGKYQTDPKVTINLLDLSGKILPSNFPPIIYMGDKVTFTSQYFFTIVLVPNVGGMVRIPAQMYKPQTKIVIARNGKYMVIIFDDPDKANPIARDFIAKEDKQGLKDLLASAAKASQPQPLANSPLRA